MSFNFKAQLRSGEIGETLFYEVNCQELERLDGRGADFKHRETGETYELKTDYYAMKDTPNFFFEFKSDKDADTPGGPWQSLSKGITHFCYLYIKDLTYFTFDVSKLVGRLETLLPDLKPTEVKNKSWITIGYRVPRAAVEDISEKVKISVSKKKEPA